MLDSDCSIPNDLNMYMYYSSSHILPHITSDYVPLLTVPDRTLFGRRRLSTIGLPPHTPTANTLSLEDLGYPRDRWIPLLGSHSWNPSFRFPFLSLFLSFTWDLHSTRAGWSGWSVRGGARGWLVRWFLIPGEGGGGGEEARFAFLCVMGWVVGAGCVCKERSLLPPPFSPVFPSPLSVPLSCGWGRGRGQKAAWRFRVLRWNSVGMDGRGGSVGWR